MCHRGNRAFSSDMQSQNIRCPQQWQMVLYNGPNVRLLADRDGAWRHAEESIHQEPGTVQVQGHALWFDQCLLNLWETHGECLHVFAVGRVLGVHWRHHHTRCQCVTSSGEDGTCLPATTSSWSQTETIKVFLLLQKCEFPWLYGVWTRSSYGSWKDSMFVSVFQDWLTPKSA